MVYGCIIWACLGCGINFVVIFSPHLHHSFSSSPPLPLLPHFPSPPIIISYLFISSLKLFNCFQNLCMFLMFQADQEPLFCFRHILHAHIIFVEIYTFCHCFKINSTLHLITKFIASLIFIVFVHDMFKN